MVDTIAHRIGNLGGAAGPLFLAMMCEAWRAETAPSQVAMAFLGSDTGERGALCVARS